MTGERPPVRRPHTGGGRHTFHLAPGAAPRRIPRPAERHPRPGDVMELGLTIPLQRFLKVKPSARGTESDRAFCRDLHTIGL